MATAIILGAGASAGSSLHPKISPPLLREMFARGIELDKRRKDRPGQLRGLLEWLRDEFGIPKTALMKGHVTYEDVLSIVQVAQIFAVPGTKPLDLHHLSPVWHSLALSGMAWDVFGPSNAEMASGRRCTLHDAIARRLSSTDVVISFNYDLLMDSSLEQAGWSAWTQSGEYGVRFDARVRDGKLQLNVGQHAEAASSRYFKLHGSVNWLCTTPDEHSAQKPAHVLVPITEFQTNQSLEYFEKIFETHFAEPMLGKPVVVPPSFLKAQHYGEDGLDWPRLWSRSAEQLATCRDWVVIGYSFGHSDVDATWLFRRAGVLAGKPRIHVADPQAGRVMDRIQSVLDGVPFTWGSAYHDLKDFVERSELATPSSGEGAVV